MTNRIFTKKNYILWTIFGTLYLYAHVQEQRSKKDLEEYVLNMKEDSVKSDSNN